MADTVIEVSIASAPAVLWPALRDPALIRRWHGWECDSLDDEIAEIYSTAVADPQTWTLRIDGGDVFSLHERDGTTLVRLERAPRRPDDAWYNDITEGWTTFVHLLAFAVEHHGLAERRTVYLEGPLLGGEDALSVVGLDGVDRVPGARYAATIAPGDYVFGVVHYVTEHQLGLTVQDLGPGLLCVATQPVTDDRPTGGVSVLLTTYGLGDDEFEEIEAHWLRWWEERTSPPVSPE